MNSKHEFALYFKNLSLHLRSLEAGSILPLNDKDLCLRITGVLRLPVGAPLILFDRQQHCSVTVHEITKKFVAVLVKDVEQNKQLTPKVTFALPLLKKDDFETALYSLVELGATVIQPIITQKVQRSWGGAKELDRAERIMIAAAEQSKNFAFPEFKEPITFEQFLKNEINPENAVVFFDPEGIPLNELLATLGESAYFPLTLMVGPEGDLTHQEKELLRQQNAIFCALTPTVLRSCQAVAVALGAVRSLIL